MDIVGNVRHENVAPLRAYYSSKDEQLMLYDYYSKGNVYALLHGMLNSSTNFNGYLYEINCLSKSLLNFEEAACFIQLLLSTAEMEDYMI
ncbi:Non-specific serine/threonine protein kinase [Handroanthus impetiginosus]|uniref:Non-specific serine/threonine protein kinase n=1 Tax=Handroanthus impetiginosus TaxID=429701 RepID=A0A2G9GXV2_9LAMI|nr:Non-specific serine/threonine protein kinase [Handroanthus impetiginosus]